MMYVKLRRMILITVMLCAVAGCKSKEEKKPLPPPSVEKSETQGVPIEVAEGVEKGKWKAVKIGIADKQKNRDIISTIEIGSTMAIPDSGLTITVHYFLPHLQMKGKKVMSVTNNLENPAAFLTVTDSEKKDPKTGNDLTMKGYLFARFPSSALNHPRYHFVLLDFIPNK